MKFEPICYDHAARLIGRRPWDVSRDGHLLASAHREVLNVHGADGCTVGIDIYNVEIEAYGCAVREPRGNGVPYADTPPLDEVSQLMSLTLDPATDGRIPMVLDAARKIAESHPEAEIRIPLSGPFTIATHLLGIENAICELFTQPEPMMAALSHLAENQVRFGLAALALGFKIALFESAVTPPLLSPGLFAERVAPSLGRVLDGLGGGVESDTQLIIGGDTRPILDSIAGLSPAYIICPVETDQAAFMPQVAGREEMTVRINMNPAVLLSGNREPAMAMREARRVLDLANRYRNTTVGTAIPFEADLEIVHEVAGIVVAN